MAYEQNIVPPHILPACGKIPITPANRLPHQPDFRSASEFVLPELKVFKRSLVTSLRIWLTLIVAVLLHINYHLYAQFPTVESFSSDSQISSAVTSRTLTLNLPAGTQNGDLLIASIRVTRAGSVTNGVTIDAPGASWNIIRNDQLNDRTRVITYWKIAFNEPNFWVWTGRNTNSSLTSTFATIGSVLRIAGADYNDPINIQGGIANDVNASQNVPAGSVTTTSANTLLIYSGSLKRGSGTFSPPVGMTEVIDINTGGSGDARTTYTIAVENRSIAGNTGNKTGVASFLGRRQIGHLVAINPFPCNDATLTLTSPAGSDNQQFCLGNSIVPITYEVGGDATGATASNLPPGVSAGYAGGVLTISGTPTTTGVFNYTVNTTGTPINCNEASASGTIAVFSVPAQPSAIAGPTSPCVGSSVVYSVTNVPGISYQWEFPPDWTQTGGGTSNSVTVTVGSTSGSVTVTPFNGPCPGEPQSLSVTVIASPAQPSPITGNPTPCLGSTQVYSVTEVAGVTYTWAFPTGWTIAAGQGTHEVIVTVGATSGNITVTPSNVCGNGPLRNLAVTVLNIPGQPGNIVPAISEVCQNSQHFFMVPNVPGVTFTWAFPGATIISGQGTNQVTIQFGNLSGTLTVTPSNVCGTGPARTRDITVLLSVPGQPGPITGEVAPCVGSTQNYSVPNVAGVVYTWTVPADWIITAGNGTNSITVTVGANAGDILVKGSNACGSSDPRILAVNPQGSLPAQPSEITGRDAVCAGSTDEYSVEPMPFVTYNWTVPADWVITAGNGTHSITVIVGNTSGNVTVTPSNNCGSGPSRSKFVTVHNAPPAQPSAITGPLNPCQSSSQTYSVVAVAGVNYFWTVPTTWVITGGQGTNAITVTVGSAPGTITVIPANACGNGPASTLAVTVYLLPVSAGPITGDTEFCEGTIAIYSVSPSSIYYFHWEVPAGWTINSGQGTAVITVTAGATSGLVQVTPQNLCGNGPTSSLYVTVNPLPAAFTGPNAAICVGASVQIGGPPVPGNTYHWTSNPEGEEYFISNPTVSPAETTIFTLTETNPATGCFKKNSVTVLANQVIELTVLPGQEITMCSGQTTNFHISSNITGTSISWQAWILQGDPANTSGFSDGNGQDIQQTLYNTGDLPYSIVRYDILAIADSCENRELKLDVILYPEPVINNQTPAPICSDVPSGVMLSGSTNGVAMETYNILSIQNNGLVPSAGDPETGTGFNASEIADDAWTNTTTSPVNVVYTVQGVSEYGCASQPFTVTLTINPEPFITTPPAFSICSGSSTNISLTANIPSNFSWTVGNIIGGITGAIAGSGNNISQVLTNPSNTNPGSVEYIVTPVSNPGSCAGNPFTITVTVHPIPQISNAPEVRICSDQFTNIVLQASTPSTFTWTIGVVTGGITGQSAGSGPEINQQLHNPSTAVAGSVQYIVTPTSVDGGCPGQPFIITVFVDPLPEVTASASPTEICPGEEFNLFSTSSLIWVPLVLLDEKFNEPTNNWLTTNQSNGGTPDNASWTLRPSGYNYAPLNVTFQSNDNTQFYLTNSYAQGSTTNYTRTGLRSPAVNTVGYSSLSLSFYHYYLNTTYSTAQVRVSLNGTIWTTVRTYNSTQGAGPTSFVQDIIDLSAYVGQTTFYIQFYYSTTTGRGRYWAIDNVLLTGTASEPIPDISWTSDPSGFTSSLPNPTNVTQTETTTYTVSYINPISGCGNSASVTVVTKEPPDAQIVADYCIEPGFIQLTALGGVSYYWHTVPPSTNQVILVDEAGIYSVTVTGANGCQATVYLNVSNELVVDGSFTNFDPANPSFYSEYIQNQPYFNVPPPYYWPDINSGLHPEGKYAVNTNAWSNYPNSPDGYHPYFYGRDRVNPGTGKFMMVNGWGNTLIIWEQTVEVHPNTDYYFSAWAVSLNDDIRTAKLRFEVNGQQVGTTANLVPGPANNTMVNPSYWMRFYSDPVWNSGAATTAVIRIVNLEPSLPGNDFGLDDISFGTLDPIPYTYEVHADGDDVCEFSDLHLYANITGGGLPPFTFSWTGPNGFTSNLQYPVIPNVSLAASGTYYVTISDSYGCEPQVAVVTVNILPAPQATISGGGDYCQFGPSAIIVLEGSGGDIPYTFEYNINGGPTNVVSTWPGESSYIIFAPTNLTGTFTYNLTSVSDNNGCERQLNQSVTVVVHSTPSAWITGEWVACPGSTHVYTANAGLAGYQWSVSGNASIQGPAYQQQVTVVADEQCGTSFFLTLVVTDENGCTATASETILVDDFDTPLISGSLPPVQVEGCDMSALPPPMGSIAELLALGLGISDNCAPNSELILSVSSAAPTGVCPIEVVRTYRVTDPCNNYSEIQQFFLIDDTTPPVFSFCPPDITVMADEGETFATISLTPPVYSDICTDVANITLTWQMTAPTPGNGNGLIPDPFVFNTGTTIVTYTATDECGNEAYCIFTVTVEPNDPPDITCPPDITQPNDPGVCEAEIDPGLPTVNAGSPVTFTWVMTGAVNDAGSGPIGNYAFPVGTTTITWTATNASGTDVCAQVITVVDVEPPSFTPPEDFEFCVRSLFEAEYYDPTEDITPDRPEYYLFESGATIFNLDQSQFGDNCCDNDDLIIHWQIDFEGGNPASISGTGQPSTYGADIELPGDGEDFEDVVHTITYWLEDCNGAFSQPAVVSITIKPRPNVVKIF